MPEVLENAGLKVAEVPGWCNYGRGEMGSVKGVICHHTAGPAKGNMPSLGTLIKGRPDLQGPLAQLGLGRDGTYYVVAAGRANHAGAGKWQGLTAGNFNFIGIEAENTGQLGVTWPGVQMDAYYRGVAAILRKVGAPSLMCCSHAEYALPQGRKNDPLFNMNQFRANVEAFLSGAAKPQLIAALDDQIRPTLRRGASGPDVVTIQRKLGIQPEDGIFTAVTEAKVREFQLSHNTVPDGIIGPKTWVVLDTIV